MREAIRQPLYFLPTRVETGNKAGARQRGGKVSSSNTLLILNPRALARRAAGVPTSADTTTSASPGGENDCAVPYAHIFPLARPGIEFQQACLAEPSGAPRQNESHSGGNPGEKQVCAVACHRGIHCTNSSAVLVGFGRPDQGVGLTALHDIAAGDAKSTRDSSERRSPAGTYKPTPAPYESKRELQQSPGRLGSCCSGIFSRSELPVVMLVQASDQAGKAAAIQQPNSRAAAQ